VAASRTARTPLPDRSAGAVVSSELLQRAEVRDVLAWIRMLVDPQDAAAVVRALARPPVELRQAHLARVIALSRRRKLDLVAGCAAALDSPRIPLEARERIESFLALHVQAAAALRSGRADAFVGALIESLTTRARPLLAPARAERRRAGLDGLEELAHAHLRAEPRATAEQLARHLAALAREAAPESCEEGSALEDAPEGDRLAETFALLREEVLESVVRIGARLSELRLDTELDISHGVVRYLELVKLAALLESPGDRDIAEVISDVNARLLAATTPVQREILESSTLDDVLIAHDADASAGGTRASAGGVEARAARVVRLGLGDGEELSLGPFLPHKGRGLALSASDIEIYRSCPLRYKFARVLRIPTEQTLHQRFGILVHQVLERYHAAQHHDIANLLALFDAGWRRGGFGDSEAEHALREKGYAALRSYHTRLQRERGTPVWFERSFNFRLGQHHVRGRVDRVDRIADAERESFELIDYKTSRAKTRAQLEGDIQLSLYALAARADWGLASVSGAYHYVLDDRKVAVPASAAGAESVEQMVLEVGEGILAQRFQATPSRAACSICDYRIACPVAER
jgi:DNA helicase II / ATP-dependent DNA helicase PcrA